MDVTAMQCSRARRLQHRALLVLFMAMAFLLVGGPRAEAGEFTINACQADRGNYSTRAFDDFATRGMFIALGGSSYAALRVTGRDVVNGSLTYRDLKRNTLGAGRIKESTLGTVRRARNADRLNGVTAARLLVRCPGGTVPVSDVCVETASRAPVPYGTAAVVCEGTDRRSGPGRRLPSHDELMTAIGDYGITLAPGGELTRNVYPSSSAGRVDALFITDDIGSVAVTPDTAAGAKAFRCVADPRN